MSRIVVGYEFDTDSDYNKAKEELQYINTIKANPRYKDLAFKLELYNTLVMEKKFETPVGLEFLRGMQKDLSKSKDIKREDIKSIPFKKIEEEKKRATTASRGEIRSSVVKDVGKITKKDTESSEKKDSKVAVKVNAKLEKKYLKYKDLYIKMIIVNIVLVLTVVGMFIVSKYSEKFDADAYRESIENDYLDWEEQLKERESAIQEKENGN